MQSQSILLSYLKKEKVMFRKLSFLVFAFMFLSICLILVQEGQAQSCDVNAFVNESHTFETQTTDPERDDLYYMFNWGDSTLTRMPSSGYVSSGTSQSASHSWSQEGTYSVVVTATDDQGATSGDSNTFIVCVAADTIQGDLNGDEQVNVSDVQLCVNVFLGTETDPVIVARADVNTDGSVNVSDVQLIVNIFLGV